MKDEGSIFEDWKRKINLVGKTIEIVESKKIFKVDYINADGSLLASNQNGTIVINNGDTIIYEL